ncbi:oleate hydratase [Hymenobacter sp. UYAg731]
MHPPVPSPADRHAYLIGGGIASLAAAVFLIRDGQMPGPNIHIFEQADLVGGSLDGSGQADTGYVLRGGRMLNFSYRCTYAMLDSVPSLEHPTQSVTDDILAFNLAHKTHAQARVVDRDGHVVDVTSMGFSEQDRLALVGLLAMPELLLGTKRVNEWFGEAFFVSNFWFMWATMFAFQPWHSLVEFKRYLLRFLHEFWRIDTLAGVDRTPYNQYDSIVRPLLVWLQGQGVEFRLGSQVTDLGFVPHATARTVARIHYRRDEASQTQYVEPHDVVLLTNGSMTANSTLGSMTTAPALKTARANGDWTLWETVAKKYSDFGRPYVFDERIDESKWESFTVTNKGTLFFDLMEAFSGNAAGTGALVTLKDSSWLLSVVLAYQPHFPQQPADVTVFWGYALYPDRVGNYVPKRMSDCTGAEILTELYQHLHFTPHLPALLAEANCIPCMLPYITSQFLTRAPGDRPQVVPAGSTNFAFVGQFVEMPDDVVFTVEYSVRSAQVAVYELLKLGKEPPAIYKGQYDPTVLFEAVKTLHR